MLQLAFLMQKLIKVRPAQFFVSSLGSCYCFLKITKSARGSFWGGPAECAGALGEILRGLEICRFEIGDMDFGCGSDTPALA